ncbi:saccharopine dehydrogenase-like oxidoreductase [Varroa jacobsoni]|uniref:Saccharopine dehydrogenase NADP binding domain-containing protein n=1 Tax=Varroa destructor TaxID=109461 RepID=A0A7M7K453_VARDE|nr:saccharopine dehydrogenase-like oxidoreductase [Varroa destructor]XP_022660111.1 saccharopine dehydrogenase-like oxidoreductase [Varroa destructor]XP_022687604.1 saccharopine dehydrogenase-like oxidoreductase [Varroa jacobsoni]XP_022687605.1 saccharopine dehydrogenase-like oxidoreductase [Varroa jacobsoni]XP_022687606.1 saccharopine dehydrogenase-like oxidoreductase [Varroa jacobsoni]
MSSNQAREFDIVIFGVTGLAGRYCAEQLHKSSVVDKVRWAAAGRNKNRISEALHEVSSWLSPDLAAGLLEVPVINAVVYDSASLLAMASRTRCVINTVGPYTRWGEPVIQACLEAGTHLLDLSGETYYNEAMRNKHHRLALEKGVVILPAAGFDSIPCEMMLQFAKQKFSGKINCLETFGIMKDGSLGSAINTGTWESILEILSFSALSRMSYIRERAWKDVFSQPWQPMEFRTRRPLFIGWRSAIPGFTLPYIAADKPVATHAEFFRREIDPTYKRVQVQTYICTSLLKSIAILFILGFAALLSQVSWGKRLLCTYPEFFTAGFFRRGGPTRAQVLSCGFTMYGIGTGWHHGDSESSTPRKRIVVRLDGPEVGYLATSICIVTSALCLVKETEKLSLRGGYLTPGFALERTSLLERLQKNQFKFSVVEDAAPETQ